MSEFDKALDQFRDGLSGKVREAIGALLEPLEKAAEAQDDAFAELQEEHDALEEQVSGLKERIHQLETSEPLTAAECLAEWARGEDPRTVGRVLDAIRGGARLRPQADPGGLR